ncbi:MAG: extracellular solute-binding protein [Spirochaetes bacterium]|nr:extracellular solute-binding protein [Spirochaetota bacterium]
MNKAHVRYVVSMVVMLFVASLAFSTGTGEPKAGGEGEEKATLRISAYAFIIQKFNFRELVSRFEKEHPSVKIELLTATQDENPERNMLKWIVSKQTRSDLYIGGLSGEMSALALSGNLIDWEDFLKSGIKKDAFIASVLKEGVFENKQQSLPFYGDTLALSVNTVMMRKAGLPVDASGKPKPAATWDELAEYAKKLTVGTLPSPSIYGLSVDVGTFDCTLTYLNTVQASRGSLFGPDGTTVDASSSEMLAFLTFCQKGVTEGWGSNGTAADVNYGRNNLKARLIAMIYEPISRCNESRTAMNVGPEEIQVMAVPGQDRNGGITAAHHAYIPKMSKQPVLAKKFVAEQLLSDYCQQWAVVNFGKFPIMRSAYKGLPADPEYATVLDLMEKSVQQPNYVDFARFNDLVMRNVQNMMVLKQTPAEAMQKIRDGYKELNLTIVK